LAADALADGSVQSSGVLRAGSLQALAAVPFVVPPLRLALTRAEPLTEDGVATLRGLALVVPLSAPFGRLADDDLGTAQRLRLRRSYDPVGEVDAVRRSRP
jgi:hypothetical protein